MALQAAVDAIASELDGKVSDAPGDGNFYARRNGQWHSFTPSIEMPFTAYNNSDQPSDKWTRLASITVDVPRNPGLGFWNEYVMQFEFALRTRGLDSDSDNAKREYTVLGKALCGIFNDRIDGKFQLTYCKSDTGAEPDALNLYCGLLKEIPSAGKWAWDLWFHNRKESDVDSNSTFIKITNIQVIGTEITDYSQIHINYFSEQTADQAASPQSDYDVFQLIQNETV